MKKLKVLSLLLMMIVLFSCNTTAPKETKEPGFRLTGTTKGIKDGSKIVLMSYKVEEFVPLTAIVKDNKFEMTGKIDIPHEYQMWIEGIKDGITFVLIYPENTDMKIHWDITKRSNYTITGGTIHPEIEKINKAKEELAKTIGYDYESVMKEYQSGEMTKERQEELRDIQMKYFNEERKLEPKYIKENPKSLYSAILIANKSHGMDAAEYEKLIAENLDSSLESTPTLQFMRKQIEFLKRTELGAKNLVDAENISYKVDNNFDGSQFKDLVYLGIFKDDNICTLKKDGSVQILNTKGKLISNFKTENNGRPNSLATDTQNNIYILERIEEKVSQKIRGRMIEKMLPKGIECAIYNREGKFQKRFKLENIIGATGARISNNDLIIADNNGQQLAVYDVKTGNLKTVIKGMRACCGILDFSINNKNEILVANLGAFRVEGFTMDGKQTLTFGKRGKSIDDFHGCCNPVNVGYLSNGAVVTVEKDPTRIKVYSKEGAKVIAGVEELVKGCAYIPMTLDSKNSIYLASPEKGMIKCIPVN